MTQVWKKTEQAVETMPDTGDVLSPLRRVRDKYLVHGARLIIKATNQSREMTEAENLGLHYYSHAADAVLALLEQ